MFKNFRDLFAIIYIALFVFWLLIVCLFLLPKVISSPEAIDPMTALITGMGIGGVTQFLIVIGTLVYQFYYRKMPDSENPTTPAPPKPP